MIVELPQASVKCFPSKCRSNSTPRKDLNFEHVGFIRMIILLIITWIVGPHSDSPITKDLT